MIYGNEICLNLINELSSQIDGIRFVYAHGTDIKDVPANEITASVGVSKCNIGENLKYTDEEGNVHLLNERKVHYTISINLFVPYSMGQSAGVHCFDRLSTYLFNHHWYETVGASLLGTTYSRDAQSLLTKSEFVFERMIAYAQATQT